ncbi:unnamed protein product [Parnassius apollo]|uniref:(apollo) hypothetical protein n=1 Tax=Parnassius apollo TaxID=110799 RepID=A0A8S3XKE3_PARAO|nr:unnamed protein product [Parnassius apollo]
MFGSKPELLWDDKRVAVCGKQMAPHAHENESFEKFAPGLEEADGTVIGREVVRFAWLGNTNDSCLFPRGGKIAKFEAGVEDYGQ